MGYSTNRKGIKRRVTCRRVRSARSGRRAAGLAIAASISLGGDVRRVLFVIHAEVIEQIGVRGEDLVEPHGPSATIRFGIVDGEIDLEPAVAHAMEALSKRGRICERVAFA